jgi:hypothetical protein
VTFRVRPFTTNDSVAWDTVVERSWNASFLHTRRFLSYHRDRFHDVSLSIEDERGRVVGVLPAALDPEDERRVVSHPGITYGAVVHGGALRGPRMLRALEAIVSTYRSLGHETLCYKAVPTIYHRVPAEDDLFALSSLGARTARSDLASVIDIQHRPPLGAGRRWHLGKAKESGITLASGSEYLPEFWQVVEHNLCTRHGARPTHTLEEISELQQLFPDRIECLVGQLDGEIVGGTVLFRLGHVVHTQYIASYPRGRAHSVLDLVLEEAITAAQTGGCRYFSFGTSMEREGSLNEGLHRFKSEFGAGGAVHQIFELSLQ